MAQHHPWIELHDLELTQHPENVRRYVEMAAALDQPANAVPAFLFCNQLYTGWDRPETTGAFLLERLQACRQKLSSQAPELFLPWLGKIDPERLSLPVFTILVAGLDAFNPCAFFVLLFLLGLLTHQRNRQRMLIIGLAFVSVSGLFYFVFMAAWLNLFLWLEETHWITITAALLAIFIGLINLKDFFAFKRGLSLTIPKSRLPGLYQRGRAVLAAASLPAMLAATLVLAAVANLYELFCTAGFPMVYTRVLTLHALSAARYYLYLALYNLIYILPLLMIVLVVTATLGKRQLSERQGRLLKLLSGLMMLEIGIVLLVAPQFLSHVGAVLVMLGCALGTTSLAAWRMR